MEKDENTNQAKKTKFDDFATADFHSHFSAAVNRLQETVPPSSAVLEIEIENSPARNNNENSPTSVGEIEISTEIPIIKNSSNDADITDSNENVASTSGTTTTQTEAAMPCRTSRFKSRKYRMSSIMSSSSDSDEATPSVTNPEDTNRTEPVLINNEVEENAYESSMSLTSSTDTESSDSDGTSDYMVESENEESDNFNDSLADIFELPFLQTANLKNKWNSVKELQCRSMGLGYKNKNYGGTFNSNMFQSRAYGSLYVVERLGLMHKLDKHEGCVNSLNFNSSGKLLASGSDDLKIIIWNWKTKKAVKTITSGHKSNVFQTKFMETNNYHNDINIVSSGRDGQVRLAHVTPSGTLTSTLLFKQSHSVHKLAIPANNTNEILTAGEDGMVKCYDMRKQGETKLLRLKKRLYSISTHPIENEFCVSGNDKIVRVYDRRNTKKPAKSICPDNLKTSDSYLTVTCCVYNYSGTEILASYSDDDIYLFDNTSQEPGKPLHFYSGHSNSKTIKGVNFFGQNSEYVISGSDCGNIYMWDKETEAIAKWMKGDETGIVNCLEAHPEFPILATSGLDNDIKIWTPKCEDKEDQKTKTKENLEKCVRRNMKLRRNRGDNMLDDRILDFLIFHRIRNARRNRGIPSDDVLSSSDNTENDDEDEEASRTILHCNTS